MARLPGASSAAGGEASDSAALAARINAGDPDAEAELIERYRTGLAILVRRLVKDPALADDLVQEVFRIAVESLRSARLHDTDKLAAYLRGIARNLAHSEFRRQTRRAETTPDTEIADPSPPADEALLREERGRMVREAMKSLSPRDCEVLQAFYLQDTAKETLCRRMGLTPAQFDLIKFRALQRLRARLGVADAHG